VFGAWTAQNRVVSADARRLIIRISERLKYALRIPQSNSGSHLIPRNHEIAETRRAAEAHGSTEIAARILVQICRKGKRAIYRNCATRSSGACDRWNEVGGETSSVTAITGAAN
jgi:hypothetical protein